MKRKILIFTSFYKPGFLAGGPIQSLFNLATLLSSEYEIYIYTQNHDLSQINNPYDVENNIWINQKNHSNVRYVSKFSYYFGALKMIFQLKPDVIYLNSLFSFGSITNLIYAKIFRLFYSVRIIVAPRGELDNGAISIKKQKKIFFIKLYSFFLKENLFFHATTDKEKKEIQKYFDKNIIEVANNIPKLVEKRKINYKEINSSKFVFISRISPKKNLLFAIECLQEIKITGNIEFMIIGPFEDEKYWDICKKAISQLPHNVKCVVKGAINHNETENLLSENHFLFFPTLAENYGHVIFESLINGLPILISNNTPWEDGEDNGVFSFSLMTKEKFIDKIVTLHKLDNESYKLLSNNAYNYAKGKVDLVSLKKQYNNLFNF